MTQYGIPSLFQHNIAFSDIPRQFIFISLSRLRFSHFFLEQNNILLTITFGSLTQLWTMVNLWMTHLYLHIQNAVFFPQQTVTYIKTHESMIKSQTNQTEGLLRQLIQGMTFCLAEAVLVFQDHSTNQCMYCSQCITIDCSLCLIH